MDYPKAIQSTRPMTNENGACPHCDKPQGETCGCYRCECEAWYCEDCIKDPRSGGKITADGTCTDCETCGACEVCLRCICPCHD